MIILPVLAFFITIIFNANFIVSILLFFGLPTLYLLLKKKYLLKKSFVFAIIFAIPMDIFLDTFAAVSGAWIITDTVFPFKFLGVATVENIIFAFFWILFSVVFYEYFFDKGKRKDFISNKMNPLVYFLIVLFILTVTVMYVVDPYYLNIPFFYLIASLSFIVIPLAWFLINYPKFIKRFIVLGAYFFFVTLLFELAALEVGLWEFTSPYFIGWVEIINWRFPLEEFTFWMMFATPALIAYYEVFADNQKLN